TLTFSGYSTLQGGGDVDHFNVTDNTTASLKGGAGADTFAVSAGKALTGSIDGEGGTDSLSVGGNAALTGSGATGFAGSNANVSAGFVGIDTLSGSGTLTGRGVASTWTLDVAQTYADGTATLT